MKRILPFKMLSAIMMVIFLGGNNSSTAANFSQLQLSNPGDSIIIQKQVSSRKHKIRLYADANQQSLLFTVKGESGRIYQLFLFDYDGTLVKQANIRTRQTTILFNIEKGDYLFEVFSDDERIETGQVLVH